MKRYVVVLFIIIFAITGCGKRHETGTVTEEKEVYTYSAEVFPNSEMEYLKSNGESIVVEFNGKEYSFIKKETYMSPILDKVIGSYKGKEKGSLEIDENTGDILMIFTDEVVVYISESGKVVAFCNKNMQDIGNLSYEGFDKEKAYATAKEAMIKRFPECYPESLELEDEIFTMKDGKPAILYFACIYESKKENYKGNGMEYYDHKLASVVVTWEEYSKSVLDICKKDMPMTNVIRDSSMVIDDTYTFEITNGFNEVVIYGNSELAFS